MLGELLPCIRDERVTRNGQTHAAPLAAWASALEIVLAARDGGKLSVPLKNHAYLFTVVIGEAERLLTAPHPPSVPLPLPQAGEGVTRQRAHSAVATGVALLEQRKRSVQ
jgi:hypothetical protein